MYLFSIMYNCCKWKNIRFELPKSVYNFIFIHKTPTHTRANILCKLTLHKNSLCKHGYPHTLVQTSNSVYHTTCLLSIILFSDVFVFLEFILIHNIN